MKIKRCIIIIVCVLSANSVLAQKQYIYYLKNSGRYVLIKDSADFIRVVSKGDSGSVIYNLKEFYKDGMAKLIGKASGLPIPQLEGTCVSYYESGKKKEVADYAKGLKVGDVYDYYPNGKLYTFSRVVVDSITHVQDIEILANNDSTGKALVTNGNGYYIGYDTHFAYIQEQGNVKDGLKEGRWKGQYIDNKIITTFTETYRNGDLLSGIAIKNGVAVNYDQHQTAPVFKGGQHAFYEFLRDNINYPKEEKKKEIQGKVYVRFIVEKDGRLSDFEVLGSASEAFSNEALRVLKKSPLWIPGYFLGSPVQVPYIQPIAFLQK